MTIKETRAELARLKLLPQTPEIKLQIQKLQQKLDSK
tara:strand:- start:396 stop:506 length:111 start_codon:yes stop_codon:yes gene_type:complete